MEAAGDYTKDGLSVDELREIEFSHCKGTYLDHAGATLYSASQIKNAMNELLTDTCGNPHSQNSASQVTQSKIKRARELTLAFFNVSNDDYDVVFTSGATESLRMVGEYFPWSSQSEFCYAFDSHTSVLGIRSYATQAGASFSSLDIHDLNRLANSRDDSDHHHRPSDYSEGSFHLFAFPAECNFTGVRHDLKMCRHVRRFGLEGRREGHWRCLVDASKYISTATLDLRQVEADYVVCSFYKVFGYPTGLGALLIRKGSGQCLKKHYFGGGTVQAILCDTDFSEPRESLSERFEDGTESFLSIMSLRHGFEALHRIGMANIQSHTSLLITSLVQQLKSLRHSNRQPLCVVYGGNHGDDYAPDRQGPVLACNFLRPDGSYIGYAQVESMASLHNIQIRTGCFCNPGACQYYLNLSNENVLDNAAAGHVCGDDVDLVHGRPTGAVRLSVGYMTTTSEIQTFVEFVRETFVESSPLRPPDEPTLHETVLKLKEMYLYPIKSCAGMRVDCWPISPAGLLYDREWLIVDSFGQTLSLKHEPKLCQIQPLVDLDSNLLTITAPNLQPLVLDIGPLDTSSTATSSNSSCAVKVCGMHRSGIRQNHSSAEWFSKCLGYPCSLVIKNDDQLRESFANQGQYLLITTASIELLNQKLAEPIDHVAFRPNFVVSGDPDPQAAHEEDQWKRLRIGQMVFNVTGPCKRCSQINIHPITGSYDGAPLKTLAKYRRERAAIYFGQFLSPDEAILFESETPTSIGVGDPVVVLDAAVK